MIKRIKHLMIMVMSLALILALTACGNKTGGNSTSKNATITVGSKDFTENLIVGELYSLALEHAGYRVKRVPNIASSLIHQSLISNQIDLYPEYTGTGLITVLKDKPLTDPKKVYQTVKKGYEKKFNVTWLNYSQANDGQGLVIRTAIANKLGIKTISDLQKHASQLRFASQGEFDQRSDGIPLLTKIYGPFKWKSEKVYDNALKYQVLKNNKADVAPAYTTEGQLVDTKDFTLLKDDKHAWPPYNLAPVVRDQVLKAHPDIAKILNKVSAKLDTKTITKLNAKVDLDKEDYKKVAKDFYNNSIK